MSRSYRHYPIVRQEKKDTKAGNRKLRHDKLAEVADGAAFKKYGVGWDWFYNYSWEEAQKDYFCTPRLQKLYSFDEWREYYLSCCVRK